MLRCPWHQYEYDLETGRCLADPERLRVRTYRVVEEELERRLSELPLAEAFRQTYSPERRRGRSV